MARVCVSAGVAVVLFDGSCRVSPARVVRGCVVVSALRRRVSNVCRYCGGETVYTLDRWGMGSRSHVSDGSTRCGSHMVDPVVVCECGGEIVTRWLESGDEDTCRDCGASAFRSIGF